MTILVTEDFLTLDYYLKIDFICLSYYIKSIPYVLGVLLKLNCSKYSRVLNKRTGRLLENEKKIPPIGTYLELYV